MSLVENLIIMAGIIVVLLSSVIAQNLALRRLHSLYYKELALQQAHALMERFRAVQSAEQMEQEQSKFNKSLSDLLPQARSEMDCSFGKAECSISIIWQEHGVQSINLKSLL